MRKENSRPKNHPQSPNSWSPLTSHLSPLILLLILALLPRAIGLDQFITTDEAHNIYSASSDTITALLQGNLRGTYWHFYPGITISWLTAIGLIGQYLLDPTPPFTSYLYGNIRQFLWAVHLPYALLTAAAVPLMYHLTRRLFSAPIAFLGALLFAFDPFYLAHSRVIHGDAPTTVFMLISTLAMFNLFQAYRHSNLSPLTSHFSLLALSATAAGLAALTKAPGQFMAIFVIELTFLHTLITYHKQKSTLSQFLTSHFSFLLAWGLISLATFIILWPAMWVEPIGTITRMISETFGKVDEGHLVYFFGQPTLDPGPWFYPYVILFRLTPISFIGLGLAFIWLIRPISPLIATTTPHRLIWIFALSLFLFGELSPKKQDRYLLPLFPFIDLLAAIGWYGLLELIKPRLKFAHFGYGLLLATHLYPTLSYYPYYLAYFNPLMGGPSRAAETTLIGWGEGMEQAATYLNNKPNAAQLYVASTPSQTFLPYFVGTGENFYTNDIAFRADYVILYLAQRQRLAPSPEIVRYYEAQTPEKIITIAGIPYIYIYPNHKRILTDIPLTATPANIGLENVMRLAGYELSATSTITLYWHALAPIKTNYTLSVRALAADGNRLVQQDSWPLNGLLPTSQWRQGDYIADTHTLELPDSTAIAQYEIIIYNATDNSTLGPPLRIKNEKLQIRN